MRANIFYLLINKKPDSNQVALINKHLHVCKNLFLFVSFSRFNTGFPAAAAAAAAIILLLFSFLYYFNYFLWYYPRALFNSLETIPRGHANENSLLALLQPDSTASAALCAARFCWLHS